MLEASEESDLNPDFYEPVAQETARTEALVVQDLRKTYSNGFTAVKGINVNMYKGQIFALLGQNGAGKTTTISMLTGLLPHSSGRAKVFNLDIFSQMDEVRNIMGVCPQHDVLFDLLTPTEHLDLFFELKNGNTDLKA